MMLCPSLVISVLCSPVSNTFACFCYFSCFPFSYSYFYCNVVILCCFFELQHVPLKFNCYTCNTISKWIAPRVKFKVALQFFQSSFVCVFLKHFAVCFWLFGYRGSYTHGHFIWNLWKKPVTSFINSIWNDHNCKILFIIGLFKKWFLVESISIENIVMDGIMTIRASNQASCDVLSYNIYDMTLRHWITAMSYDKKIYAKFFSILWMHSICQYEGIQRYFLDENCLPCGNRENYQNY